MINDMKIVATIEARMTSSRLPGKVLMPYCNIPNLIHIVNRLKKSNLLDEVVVATTVNDSDNPIVELCEANGIQYFRGSEEDVLLRVLEAAKSVSADLIVEITGDCPVIDWNHVDHLINLYFEKDCDYASNIIERSFPRGFDTQVFSVQTLEKVNELTQNPVDHEHVSLFIYTHPELFKLANWKAEGKMNRPDLEITLDTHEDYELIQSIYEALYPTNPFFTAEDVLDFLSNNDVKKPSSHRKDPFSEQKGWLERHEKDI